METNEQRKKAIREAIQEELEGFFAHMQELSDQDLEHLEEQVVQTSQQMGRRLLEGILDSRLREQRPVARRQGRCGHRQRLVGERPKQLLSLVGPVTFVRPYYQCLAGSEAEVSCTHGEAPDDALWGVQERRTTSGVQREISYLCGRLTFEEAAESLCRHVPLDMSARQALILMRPVGEALAKAEDQQVKRLQAQAQQARSESPQAQQTEPVERLYIEVDGVFARMRRGSVPMEPEERHRQGDIYREIKAGAVFRAERGCKRSELAPGVYVDTPEPDSLRYVARRTAKGGFDWLLYHLAEQGGLAHARAWWSSLATALRGSGIWRRNTFPELSRSWISLMPKNTCGTWLTPSLALAQQQEQPGPRQPARCWKRGTRKRSFRQSTRCRPSHRSQGKLAVFLNGPWTPLPPTKSACAIPSSVHKGCIWAVARLRPPAKPLSAPVPNALGCGFPPEGIDALLPVRTAVRTGAYDPLWAQAYAA